MDSNVKVEVEQLAYLHNAHLVEKRKILKLESLVTDLEYADDMALLSDNWDDLITMMDSLSSCCMQEAGPHNQP